VTILGTFVLESVRVRTVLDRDSHRFRLRLLRWGRSSGRRPCSSRSKASLTSSPGSRFASLATQTVARRAVRAPDGFCDYSGLEVGRRIGIPIGGHGFGDRVLVVGVEIQVACVRGGHRSDKPRSGEEGRRLGGELLDRCHDRPPDGVDHGLVGRAGGELVRTSATSSA
jgi:hypothetical protein